MEPAEIRERLMAYRPGVDDAADPLFAEALAAAEHDPELARWLAEEQALDATFAGKLRQAPVPADLKSNLLGLAKVVAPPTNRWRQTWWPALAGAAAAAVVTWLAARATLRPTPVSPPERTVERLVETSATVEDFRKEMVAFVRLNFSLEKESRAVEDLRDCLRQDGSPDGGEIPAGLLALPGNGCRSLFFRGHKVGLICFTRKNGQLAHLIVVDRAAVGDSVGTREQPQFQAEGSWMTAAWTEGNLVYLVAVKGDEGALSAYLDKIGGGGR